MIDAQTIGIAVDFAMNGDHLPLHNLLLHMGTGRLCIAYRKFNQAKDVLDPAAAGLAECQCQSVRLDPALQLIVEGMADIRRLFIDVVVEHGDQGGADLEAGRIL